MTNLIKFSLLASSLALFSACANVGHLAQNWGNKLREYQINPLFPPREDVYVGDIYLSSKSTENLPGQNKDGFLPIGLLITHIDLENSASDFYSNRRPNFPNTVVEGDINAQTNFDSSKDDEKDIFKSRDNKRLRLVAFPDFLAVSEKSSGLGASIPGQTLVAVFGYQANDFDSASISIPSAESYTVPALDAQEKITKDVCAKLESISTNLTLGEDNRLIMITEMYYAREMNITLRRKSSSGFQGQALLAASVDKLGKIVSDIEASWNKPSDSIESVKSNKSIGEIEIQALEKKYDDLSLKLEKHLVSLNSDRPNLQQKSVLDKNRELLQNEVLSELDQLKRNLAEMNKNNTTPGIGFWTIKSLGMNVSLNGSFKKPIAIGYRGFEINTAKMSCSFKNSANPVETQFGGKPPSKSKSVSHTTTTSPPDEHK